MNMELFGIEGHYGGFELVRQNI